jgi:uncharacterized protein
MAGLALIDPTSAGYVAAVFVLGGMVKGTMGFGLPLTTMALMPFVLPVDVALAINVLVLFLTNIAQFVQMGQMRETATRFAPVLWGIVIGVVLGSALVQSISDNALLLALGAVVVGFAALSLTGANLSVPASRERPAGWVTGVLGGVLGALTTVGGPLFVMYLVGLGVNRRMFLSAVSLFFLLSAILISGAFLWAGMFDVQRVLLAAIALPAALLGMGVGDRIGARVPAHRFRALVLGVLGVLGLNLIWRGISGG